MFKVLIPSTPEGEVIKARIYGSFILIPDSYASRLADIRHGSTYTVLTESMFQFAANLWKRDAAYWDNHGLKFIATCGDFHSFQCPNATKLKELKTLRDYFGSGAADWWRGNDPHRMEFRPCELELS